MMLAGAAYACLSLLTGSWARREAAARRGGAGLRTLERRAKHRGRKGRSARRRLSEIDTFSRYIDRLGRRPRWWRYARERVSLRLVPDEEVGGLFPFGWTWTDKFFDETSPLLVEARFTKVSHIPWFWTILGLKRPAWYDVASWRPVGRAA